VKELKNGKRIGKKIATEVIGFGKGMKEAYEEECKKPVKRKTAKKRVTTTTKRTTTKLKGTKMTLSDAKKRVKNKLGLIDMATYTENKDKLVLFYSVRGAHKATYNRTTGKFWYI
jgi:type IV secretory pathway VirJ component